MSMGNAETLTGTIYHAWNLVWIEEEDSGGKWWRYDATGGYGLIDPEAAPEPIRLRGRPIYGEPREIW